MATKFKREVTITIKNSEFEKMIREHVGAPANAVITFVSDPDNSYNEKKSVVVKWEENGSNYDNYDGGGYR